jgi:hypothetical protein
MDDPGTSMGFPSNWNTCHRSNPIAPPRFNHQQEFCLGGKYDECPLFLSKEAIPLPLDLRFPGRPPGLTRNKSRKNLVIVLIILIAVLITGWGIALQRLSPAVNAKATQATPESAMPTGTTKPPPTDDPAFPLISKPTMPSTNLFVNATATRRPHGIDDWIGVNYIFRIYRAEQGLSLESLASVYNTTAAAVVAVNYKLSTPLVPGQLIIIPINQKDVSNLPQFEIYHVKENMTINSLASKLDVDPDLLRYFNGFPTSEQQLIAKEWIIIPRERPKTQ